MARPRVLLVHHKMSSFVQMDHDILAEAYDVEPFPLPEMTGPRREWSHVYGDLWRAIGRADLVYWWFAGRFSAAGAWMARLRGTPFVVVAGGYDVAREPAIGYGRTLRSRAQLLAVRQTLRRATLALTVSPHNDAEAAWFRPRRHRMIPLGIDPEVWRPGPDAPRPDARRPRRPIVLTVGLIHEGTERKKGLLTFADASRLVPEADFFAVGGHRGDTADRMRQRGGDNLSLPGFVADADLKRLLREAAVYAQLSWHESFGVALVEATASGCVPVACQERVGAADLLGDVVVRVPYGDVEAVAQGIRAGLGQAEQAGVRERLHARVEGRLPLQARRTRLLAEMDSLLDRA